MPTEAAELVFDEATKQYSGTDGAAVDRLSLTVPAGEICVLVGPSGGGKTTALRLVNRLIELTSGDIRIDGTSIREQNLVQLRRGIGYVIQQVGLFPHMTIEAIVRTRLQDEFLRLQREVRKTVVFVTHDIDEAIKVGDRIAILRRGGRLAQYDTPKAILEQPADEFVAEFVGADRALKALALRTLAELELGAPTDGPRLPRTATLREALALLVEKHAHTLAVTDESGAVVGSVTREALLP